MLNRVMDGLRGMSRGNTEMGGGGESGQSTDGSVLRALTTGVDASNDCLTDGALRCQHAGNEARYAALNGLATSLTGRSDDRYHLLSV